jgi:hypothetical protein
MSDTTFKEIIREDGTVEYVRSDYEESVKRGQESAKNPTFVPGPEFFANLEETLKKQYQNHRQPEYPPMVEFVDAYYWMTKGDNSKMDAYIAKIDEIKSKYPKLE